jgi:hypothetical protein
LLNLQCGCKLSLFGFGLKIKQVYIENLKDQTGLCGDAKRLGGKKQMNENSGAFMFNDYASLTSPSKFFFDPTEERCCCVSCCLQLLLL